MENMKEINLSELLSALLRKIWLIVLCAVIAGALFYGYTANFMTEMYKSRITVYVNSSQGNTLNISAAELAAIFDWQKLRGDAIYLDSASL